MSQKSPSAEWVDAPVGAPVVRAVLLVGKIRRPRRGFRFAATSLPGHLIQLTVSGRTRVEVGGRQYDLRLGSLVWHHEDESVRGVVNAGPWVFYTVNFVAPALSPPPFERRVQQVGPTVMRTFARLLKEWNDRSAPPVTRAMGVQAELLSILSRLRAPRTLPYAVDPAASLWWGLETQLRQGLSRSINLAMMSAISGKSVATIARSCRAALGVAPMKRVKQIRLSLARGLVYRSDLTLTQIARRIGYDRVHEFSRDYRKHFSTTATADRFHVAGESAARRRSGRAI